MGVDEFSYRKRHRYLAVAVDHARDRVVWAARGRSGSCASALAALRPAPPSVSVWGPTQAVGAQVPARSRTGSSQRR
jgi:hypothetical protein